ncbi:MAG: undecaprenyldiphospho-muramoylpentapeptide beta-N-acetylglucosaminyltransferase [Ruminococcaceae bacterium]|nr:undecaprenyldiphospho-muramoylpentapeptide beta-N-acetylglucosaminyltransferase [Oscillospiraceae bacterium]
MRVLISGGGTGGHINPALAIAQMLREKYKDAVIEYVGTKRGLETKLVPREGYKLHTVKVRGFSRSLSPANIDAAIKAVTSVWEAKKIIKDFRPDIVIGTGGYVCWPVLKAAAKMGIPTAVHEQNAVVGMTVKMLAKYVDKVMISFEESRELFDCPEKLVLTGNPIKPEMLRASASESRKKLGFDEETPMILSYGGSLGAMMINRNVLSVIENFSEKNDVYHVHATGRGEWQEIKSKLLERGYTDNGDYVTKGKVTVREYIYDMPVLLSAADIVISRAGAMTIAEIAALGKASVMIPSPNVTNNHQYKNAHVLEKAGGAVLIQEKDLTPDTLANALSELINDREKLQSLKNNVRQFAVTDSLDRVEKVVNELLGQKGG